MLLNILFLVFREWNLYTLSRDSQPHVNGVVLGCGHCWSRVCKIV